MGARASLEFDLRSWPQSRSLHRPLLLLLAAIQFTHVLDFVMIMPLGPQLISRFGLSPAAFGLLVSSYNLAAATASLVGVFALDKFDRRSTLLFSYCGFAVGTFTCGVAENYHELLAARILAGAFGGLIQTAAFTIIGDMFSENERGAATGTVMSAFSAASVIGVPVGLFLAARHGWRTPFLIIAVTSCAILLLASRLLPRMRGHLRHPGKSRRGSVRALLFERNTLAAIALTVNLMFAGFTVIPYISAYLVGNVGLTQADIALVFLAGGLATFLTSRFSGTLSDRFGKHRAFTIFAAASILPIIALTNLPRVPLPIAIVTTTLFTVLISARSVPALALITSSVDSHRRGRFLSLTSSVQQASSAVASFMAGLLLGIGPDGRLSHYGVAGLIAVVATALSIFAARELNPSAGRL